MKTNIIKNVRSGGTFIDIMFFLLIGLAIYGAIVYVPYLYKAQELQVVVKDYTFRTGGANTDQLRAAVIEDARKKLEIELNEDDVHVTLDGDRTRIEATWRPIIKFVGGIQFQRKFNVEYDRKQLK